MFETYDKFFNLSPEVKAKYRKKKITSQNVSSQNGWDAVEAERYVIPLKCIYNNCIFNYLRCLVLYSIYCIYTVLLFYRTNLDRPGDLKESFDLESFDDGTFVSLSFL